MSQTLLSYEEAFALVSAKARTLGAGPRMVEQVDLKAAMGRILAEPLLADRDQPPFSRSTRDGYACRAEEAMSRVFLSLAGSIRAGDAPAAPLAPGAVWEIMTGSPVPEGADAVAMLEHTETSGGQVRLAEGRTVGPGENIVPRGREARQGDEIVAAGIRLAPPHIAAAAACGYANVPVFLKPRISILATGDELVPIDAAPGPGQIRNSNSSMLAVMVIAAGGKPVIHPTASDDPEALDSAINQAANADMLLISGGVSAGKYDLVEDALARAGAVFHFTGVRIQPGGPVVFGQLPRGAGSSERLQPFFGLPGNPISSAVTFRLFAAQVLAQLAGNAHLGPPFALARLARECKGKPGLTRFVPAGCNFSPPAGELPSVAAVEWQGSGDLAAFARSNCFIVVPDKADLLAAGEIVQILLP